MKIYEMPLENELWFDFQKLLSKTDILKSYDYYFTELIEWIKLNRSLIGNEMLRRNRIDTLIEIEDISKYIAFSPEIKLANERKRMVEKKPDMLDTFVMDIGNTLWDLVKQYSGVDCPKCKCTELDYVIANPKSTSERILIMECETCGWEQYINENEYDKGEAKIYPVSKKDLDQCLFQNKRRKS